MKEQLMPFGVYYHEKKGFALVTDPTKEEGCDEWAEWQIDKGQYKSHPFLRVRIPVVSQGSGRYFMEKHLKNYEYWGEL